MSFMPEQFSLAVRGAPGSKHDFPGSSPLLTGAVVLGSHHHHGSPLLPLHDLVGQHSPSNSSQSDTATDAQLSMGGGSAGAAAAAAAGGAAAAAAAADAASGPVSTNQANTSSGGPPAAAAGKRAGSGRYQAQHIPASVIPAGAGFDPKREWLYRLVTFPHYFTPCVTCCSGSSTPKREQLMTLFDTRAPHRVFCCHCPTPKGSTGHFSASHGRDGALLQVRRSSFKNAVNANDISRFGADLGGVQQYTLNGNKIIYLAREQSAKKTGHGAPPPASCTVDGRAMMDKNSLYCSLMCKMQAEDPGFTNWLDSKDPSVRILAQVSANAPPVPTVACKRTYYASARDSSSSPKSSGSGSGMSKDSPAGSGASVGLPPLSMAVGLAGAGGGGGGVVNAGVFSSAVNRAFGGAPQGGGGGVGGASSRPAKAPRLTARANSAPLSAFTAGAGGSSLAGSSGNEALLLGMAASGRSSSGALLEGLTSRPVARQLLPHNGPDAAAVEAAARQAAVAAAAAAFSGAGTSAAAAAARDALGAAGLAPIRTGNGSPVYSSISQAQRQQQQQQRQQQQQPGAAAAAAAAGGQQQQHRQQGKKAVSAFAAAAGAGGSNAGGCKQLTQKSVKVKVNGSKAASVPRPESPKAPGLGAATAFGPLTTSISLPEPFLPGAEVPGSIPALPVGFEGVGGLLDTGFSDMGPPGAGSSAPWGSVGDIAGLLGVSDSHSPMHPMGLDGFDAFFGDGSLSPAPQMLF